MSDNSVLKEISGRQEEQLGGWENSCWEENCSLSVIFGKTRKNVLGISICFEEILGV